VALTVDLGGTLTVDAAVAAIVRDQAKALEALGATVDEAAPSLPSADQAFRTLRAWQFYNRFSRLVAHRPEGFKQTLRDNIQLGESLTGDDVARAHRQATTTMDRMRVFFETHDVLAMPVSQVPPFSAETEYPTSINGVEQTSYLDWMRSAYLITMTGCPAISVPAGFTAEGWPVGLQLVTAPRTERRLLEIARAFEQATGAGLRRPDLRASA